MIPNRLAFAFLLLAVLMFSAPDNIAADASSDLEEHHPGYPPELHELVIDSAGSRMAALAYVAAGKGPHPTVILLHGYPGDEKNPDGIPSSIEPTCRAITYVLAPVVRHSRQRPFSACW